MKKMSVFLCITATALLFSGCKPIYEKQIEGQWSVYKYSLNDVDGTTVHQFQSFTFLEGGTYSEKWAIVSTNGTWQIDRKEDGKLGEYQLILSGTASQGTYDITEFKKDTLTLSRTTNAGLEVYTLNKPETDQ